MVCFQAVNSSVLVGGEAETKFSYWVKTKSYGFWRFSRFIDLNISLIEAM